MVRKVQFFSWLVFIMVLVFSAGLSIYGAGTNLVKNPGFEEASGVLPANWAFKDGTLPQGVKYEISKQMPHSGSNCLAIANTEAFDTMIIQKFNVQRDKVYHVSCWVRTENIANKPGSANISMYYGDNGFGCKGIYTSRELSDTGNKWQLLEFYFQTLKISDPLTLALRLGGQGTKNQGTAYFDDLTVELVQNPTGIQVDQFYVPGKQTNTAANQNSGNPGTGKSNPIVIYIILGVLGLGLLAYFEIKLSKKDKTNAAESDTEETNQLDQ